MSLCEVSQGFAFPLSLSLSPTHLYAALLFSSVEVDRNVFERLLAMFDASTMNAPLSEQEAARVGATVTSETAVVEAIFQYWCAKIAKSGRPHVIPRLKADLGETSSGNDPYIAFRRRVERMKTRRNQKNEETSYMNMVKMRRDFQRVCDLLAMIHQRELTKQQLLHVDLDVFRHRVKMGDWSKETFAACLPTPPPEEPLHVHLPIPSHAPERSSVTDTDLHESKRRRKLTRTARVARHPTGDASSSSDSDVSYTSAETDEEYDTSMYKFRRRQRARYVCVCLSLVCVCVCVCVCLSLSLSVCVCVCVDTHVSCGQVPCSVGGDAPALHACWLLSTCQEKANGQNVALAVTSTRSVCVSTADRSWGPCVH